MATRNPGVLRDFRAIFEDGTTGGLTDAQLLDRFAARRGEAEAAFEGLLTRYAPMVLGICRRVLRDPNDVDDAFQATFLILSTRAASIREPGSLGGWLARVALRVSIRADDRGKRRREQERRASRPEIGATASSPERDEALAAMDEEVDRLPDRFRGPVVLCHLEGLTHDEAALRLRCPVGTVRSRLSRARDRLKARLTRRGLAPAEFAWLAPMTPSAASIEAATRAALQPSTASAAAILLKKGVLMTMLWARWKRASLIVFVCGSAAGALAFETIPRTQAPVLKPALAVAPVAPEPDEPPPPAVLKVDGRVVEGVVIGPDREPIAGARVFFSQADRAVAYLEAMTARTDASGRYRLDLTPPYSLRGKLKTMILAPGFRMDERTFDLANGPAHVDFELTSQPWKETELRLVDPAGGPVEGVRINANVSMVSWVLTKSDARGLCRISMAPGIPQQLGLLPEDARPMSISLRPLDEEPASITITVLPPIRGLVVDQAGRPLPKVYIGQTIFQGTEGRRNLAGFHGGKSMPTDRDGMFELTFMNHSRSPDDPLSGSSRARTQALCIIDRDFRLLAYRTFDPAWAIEPMVIKLGPLRRVHFPLGAGWATPPIGSKFFDRVSLAPPPDLPGLPLTLIYRELTSKGDPEGLIIEEELPEGTYQIEVRIEGSKRGEVIGKATREVVVKPGEWTIDLAPLTPEPTPIVKPKG